MIKPVNMLEKDTLNMFKKLMPHVFGVIFILSLFQTISVQADELSAGDRNDFQRIISAQIKAFQIGDNIGAYSFAAPNVQRLFPDAQSFVAMVKRNYSPVFQPLSFRFVKVSAALGKPIQHMSVVDIKGILWNVLYAFERQSDSNWKISGVVLYRHQGSEA